MLLTGLSDPQVAWVHWMALHAVPIPHYIPEQQPHAASEPCNTALEWPEQDWVTQAPTLAAGTHGGSGMQGQSSPWTSSTPLVWPTAPNQFDPPTYILYVKSCPCLSEQQN